MDIYSIIKIIIGINVKHPSKSFDRKSFRINEKLLCAIKWKMKKLLKMIKTYTIYDIFRIYLTYLFNL